MRTHEILNGLQLHQTPQHEPAISASELQREISDNPALKMLPDAYSADVHGYVQNHMLQQANTIDDGNRQNSHNTRIELNHSSKTGSTLNIVFGGKSASQVILEGHIAEEAALIDKRNQLHVSQSDRTSRAITAEAVICEDLLSIINVVAPDELKKSLANRMKTGNLAEIFGAQSIITLGDEDAAFTASTREKFVSVYGGSAEEFLKDASRIATLSTYVTMRTIAGLALSNGLMSKKDHGKFSRVLADIMDTDKYDAPDNGGINAQFYLLNKLAEKYLKFDPAKAQTDAMQPAYLDLYNLRTNAAIINQVAAHASGNSTVFTIPNINGLITKNETDRAQEHVQAQLAVAAKILHEDALALQQGTPSNKMLENTYGPLIRYSAAFGYKDLHFEGKKAAIEFVKVIDAIAGIGQSGDVSDVLASLYAVNEQETSFNTKIDQYVVYAKTHLTDHRRVNALNNLPQQVRPTVKILTEDIMPYWETISILLGSKSGKREQVQRVIDAYIVHYVALAAVKQSVNRPSQVAQIKKAA